MAFVRSRDRKFTMPDPGTFDVRLREASRLFNSMNPSPFNERELDYKSLAHTISIPGPAQRYTLSALRLEETHVQLNDKELQLMENDDLPELQSVEVPAGNVSLEPATITFLV